MTIDQCSVNDQPVEVLPPETVHQKVELGEVIEGDERQEPVDTDLVHAVVGDGADQGEVGLPVRGQHLRPAWQRVSGSGNAAGRTLPPWCCRAGGG